MGCETWDRNANADVLSHNYSTDLAWIGLSGSPPHTGFTAADDYETWERNAIVADVLSHYSTDLAWIDRASRVSTMHRLYCS